MRKYLFLFTASVLSNAYVFSQISERRQIDSLRYLTSLFKGKEKVDCLNQMAQIISRSSLPDYINWKQKSDSVYRYSTIAFEESKKINYKKGIAYSLTLLANAEYLRGIELRINKKNDDDATAGIEKFLSQAIPVAKDINDNETLGYAYELWGHLLYLKSKFSDNESKDIYYKKAIEHFAIAGNKKKEGELCLWLGESYKNRGFYEESFEYCNRAIELTEMVLPDVATKEEKDFRNWFYWQCLMDIAQLYKEAGDYKASLYYINKAERFSFANDSSLYDHLAKADIFNLNRDYDSSFYYINKAIAKDPNNPFLKSGLGATYLLVYDYNNALILFQQALPDLRKRNVNGRILVPTLLNIGSSLWGKKDYAKAMIYVREGMGIAQKLGTRPEIMQGYELLSKIHHELGNNDSAYLYLLKFISIKDSIQNRQFILRLNNAKKEAQIGLLNKDNKIKEQRLKQEASLKKFLIAGLLLLLLAGIFIFRFLIAKRRNEKLISEKIHKELQRRSLELEMLALRAQMNPHFIFNCLSSINKYILKNEPDTASNYLTRFSRLIRMVLHNSQKSLITLEDELEMLTIYLDMERMRFKDAFNYHISFTNRVDTGDIFIPPLLLQPFCENAIWHGLKHLADAQPDNHEPGRLNIILSMDGNVLNCTITDNGIGRKKAAEMKSKSAEDKKSMGLKITEERLTLLNQDKSALTSFEIEDLQDGNGNSSGTRVKLRINCRETVETLT